MQKEFAVSCEGKMDIGTEERRAKMKKIFRSLSLEKYFEKNLYDVQLYRNLKNQKFGKLDKEEMKECRKQKKAIEERVYGSKKKSLCPVDFGLKLLNKLTLFPINECYRDDDRLHSKKVYQAVTELLKLMKKEESFFSDDKAIYMQITSVRMPITTTRLFWITLPHTLLSESSDVCLIIKDKRTHRKLNDFETSAEYYRKYLKKCGVMGISEIITLRQLKREYDVHEMKEALFRRFDFFLVDKSIERHAAYHLGRDINKKKAAVPISLNPRNLKKRVNVALRKAFFKLHPTGNTFSLKVGHMNLTATKISENISAARRALKKSFPGGWDNILSLSIKSSHSIAFPVHLSTGLDGVEVPVVKPAGFENECVIGNLDNKPVKVDASGEVTPYDDMASLKRDVKKCKTFGNKVLIELEKEELMKLRREKPKPKKRKRYVIS